MGVISLLRETQIEGSSSFMDPGTQEEGERRAYGQA